jgi:2-hydroxymuconate-semialdehyde hydrolase
MITTRGYDAPPRNRRLIGADLSDSLTFPFETMSASYTRSGKGPALLLLHGSGPGASSLGNWRTVMGGLAEHYTVHAMDLIGFGKSDRRPEPPYFDYAMWVRQARAMLTEIGGGEPVGIIGHSLSGSIALSLASSNPRIAGVMTTGTMGADFEPNDATHRTWRCPRTRDELRATLAGLIHDHSLIDDAYLAAREPVVFAPGYADYFDQMFEGDQRRYVRAAVLADATLQAVRCPVLMLHGRNDTAFPAESTLRIADRLPQADVLLLARCSHSVAFEHSKTFLANAKLFFDRAFGVNP